MDGGVRSGQDVLKALAKGAKAVFIGRAFLYRLGALGEKGVAIALETIHRGGPRWHYAGCAMSGKWTRRYCG